MKRILTMLLAAMLLLAAAGCGGGTAGSGPWVDVMAADLEEPWLFDDAVPLEDVPKTVFYEYEPKPAGLVIYEKNSAVIDASNTADGYVMCKYTGGEAALKVRITGPGDVKLDFSLRSDGVWEAFPLSYGDGAYKIGVYKQKAGTKYTALLSQSVDVVMTDPLGPFLRANQKVYFTPDSAVTAKAAALCDGKTTELEKVAAVYAFVTGSIGYDYDKAQQIVDGVITGYVPDVDAVLAAGKGVCSDYSSLMAAMLRSQGVATKVVYGYAGTVYHAWISVYTEEYGWVEAAIYFDGKQWMRMDPTFAATADSSSKIMSYIGDGSNYTVKYMY